MKQQRRGRKIAMTSAEVDSHLAQERTCRVATVGADGAPHVTPLWFAWDGTSLWLTSIVSSQRWTDLQRDPRISIIVDSGHDFMELRGVELRGRAVAVGEIPRTGEPCPELDVPERTFAEKYAGGRVQHDGRHAWLRVTPEKLVSWDFRKISG
jgi:PPOX class probable F420-dependent enzyme